MKNLEGKIEFLKEQKVPLEEIRLLEILKKEEEWNLLSKKEKQNKRKFAISFLERESHKNINIEYEKNVSNNGRTVYEKHYFSSGKLDFEATYKDGQLDGVVKKYGENGQIIQQGTFKNGVQVK